LPETLPVSGERPNKKSRRSKELLSVGYAISEIVDAEGKLVFSESCLDKDYDY